MPTRREVLWVGAGVASLGALAGVGARALGATLPVHRVLIDQRFAASDEFGAHAQRLGAEVRSVHDGVHDVWQQELYPQWRQSAVSVAGMTPYAALFCLETVARDAGLQLIYRVNHRLSAERVSHEAYGSYARLAQHPAFVADGWTQQAAERVLRWPAGRQSVSASRSNIARADERGVAADILMTWLMAPVRVNRLA